MNTTLVITLALLASDSCPEPFPKSKMTSLLESLGIFATAEIRGDIVPEVNGNVEVIRAGHNGARKLLTSSNDFRSPIFIDNSLVLAIRADDTLVKLKVDGGHDQVGVVLATIQGIDRIAGLLPGCPGVVAILAGTKERYGFRFFNVHTGSEMVEAKYRFDKVIVPGNVRRGARIYADTDRSIVIEEKKNSKGGFDIFAGDRQLTKCFAGQGDAGKLRSCSQGALAEDGSLVYIVSSHS